MPGTPVMVGMMLTLSLAGCLSDLRTGQIPNWLTFPGLLLGPAISAAFSGTPGLTLSGLGILIAGGVALLMYRLGGLGGGDLKLFAALAGFGGPRLGLEIELFALCAVLFWGFARLWYRQQLSASLRTSARLLIGAPSQREITLTHVRLGGAIFAGTVLALAKQL